MYETRDLTTHCPECHNDLSFNKAPQLGDFIFCPECETTSEVIEVEPLKLDWYFEEPFNDDEDYDDDDGYDDEEYDDDYDDEEYDDYDDEEYDDDDGYDDEDENS